MTTNTQLYQHLHLFSTFRTDWHAAAGSRSQPVVSSSRRYKSFTSSVVNWAFSECWPVCHCVHRRFVRSERRKKIRGDYPQGENPQEASRSARVHCGSLQCQGWQGGGGGPTSNESGDCGGKTQQSSAACAKNTHSRTWRAKAIISFGTAKPLRDVYLTRLAV